MSTETISPPICKKCGCEKTKWRKDVRKKAGGYWACGQCAYEGDRRRYLANPEANHAAARRYAAKESSHVQKRARERGYHLENPEKNKEVCRTRYYKDPQKSIRKSIEWARQNPKLAAEKAKRWRHKNPEKAVAKDHRRRALKLNASVPDRPVTDAIVKKRKALFGGCCFCGADKKLELEHVVALVSGGLHVEENLLGACRSCNGSKHSSPVEAWFRKQPFFSEQRWQEIQEVTGCNM